MAGRPKVISGNDNLIQLWEEYKIHAGVISVPTIHPKLGVVNIDIPAPIHARGFNVWLYDHGYTGVDTIHDYLKNKNGQYAEYAPSISRIKDDIFNHNYQFAAVGQHKEKLTMALLGLAEKKEEKSEQQITHTGEIKIETNILTSGLPMVSSEGDVSVKK